MMWKDEVNEFCGNIPSVLIGNKIDLPRNVKKQEAERYVHILNAPYFETSVLQNTNVSEIFEAIGRLMLERIESQGNPPVKEPVSPCQDNTGPSNKTI